MHIKPITGMPGYFVSYCGKILTNKKFTTKPEPVEMKTKVRKSGYSFVRLRVNGTYKGYVVHRLIAKEWCAGYAEGMTVNHKNCIKTDNRAENLEWMTLRDNIIHSVKAGLRKYKNPTSGYGKPVWRATKDAPDQRIISVSLCAASREIGIPFRRGIPNIFAAINGKQKSAYGFLWGYHVCV